ncbi:Oligosaccaryltransferase-domain-containing protein [Hypoxylon sp. FL0890]|nr:Oligosaccaryltransferase-domain-containing protein [Hypoxylon sp. FL0890]
MISDDDLYSLAIFLGSIAMVLIVLYHFFEVNSGENSALAEKAIRSTPAQQPPAVGRQPSGTKRQE